jgi:hypothetical protein
VGQARKTEENFNCRVERDSFFCLQAFRQSSFPLGFHARVAHPYCAMPPDICFSAPRVGFAQRIHLTRVLGER